MYQPKRRRNTPLLVALIVIAAIYALLSRYGQGLTGSPDVDGGIGVLLGLYICSRGAGNLLDKILYGHILQRLIASRRSETLWLLFNVLIIAIGWGIIFMGATQFVRAVETRQVTPPRWR